MVILEDRIADALFQDLSLKPAHFDVIAGPNLNGDYVSDAVLAVLGWGFPRRRSAMAVRKASVLVVFSI